MKNLLVKIASLSVICFIGLWFYGWVLVVLGKGYEPVPIWFVYSMVISLGIAGLSLSIILFMYLFKN